jgi:hypothetical protein
MASRIVPPAIRLITPLAKTESLILGQLNQDIQVPKCRFFPFSKPPCLLSMLTAYVATGVNVPTQFFRLTRCEVFIYPTKNSESMYHITTPRLRFPSFEIQGLVGR